MTILLNNRYQVLQVLGAGGFGETFLAEDTHLPSRRRCVLKQLKPIANDTQTYQLIQRRFEREAATLEFLGEGSHQIPKLYAYFSENGQFYLVQEWIQGQTLTEIVQSQGLLSETSVKEILLSLLPVLEYVHSKGIIHRDIKPDNIILRASYRGEEPVLIDFGAVKETIVSVVNSPGYATQSMVIGTPGYMPSEQAVGRPVYGTDIYSLGLTAIYLLTGKHPQEFSTNLQTGEILWQDYAPHISLYFATVLNQAIKPQVSDRYTTVGKMLHALQAGTTNATVTMRPTPAVSQKQTQPLLSSPDSPPPSNSQKPIWIVGGVLLSGLIGAVAISGLSRQQVPEVPVAVNSTPTPESVDPTFEEPQETPIFSQPSPVAVAPTSRQPRQKRIIATPTPTPIDSPLEQQQQPITSQTQPEIPATVPTVSTPQPEKQNQTPVIPTPQARSTPEKSNEPLTTPQSIPAFPTGTTRSTVEAVLGKKGKDSRGVWPNTRAVTYNVLPNKIDVGFLFDRDSGILRQTEAAFAQTIDPQVMQTTLNGILGAQASAEIHRGLQQVQQRQSDNFTFTAGSLKGQIVRQDCDFIYISIWDSDLHDFVNPSDAKKC